LKRVYYSGYVPVNNDRRLPALQQPPLVREHRLYQADWLIRLYGFQASELFDEGRENLEEADPRPVGSCAIPVFFWLNQPQAGTTGAVLASAPMPESHLLPVRSPLRRSGTMGR
jgi:hypothetical protein